MFLSSRTAKKMPMGVAMNRKTASQTRLCWRAGREGRVAREQVHVGADADELDLVDTADAVPGGEPQEDGRDRRDPHQEDVDERRDPDQEPEDDLVLAGQERVTPPAPGGAGGVDGDCHARGPPARPSVYDCSGRLRRCPASPRSPGCSSGRRPCPGPDWSTRSAGSSASAWRRPDRYRGRGTERSRPRPR